MKKLLVLIFFFPSIVSSGSVGIQSGGTGQISIQSGGTGSVRSELSSGAVSCSDVEQTDLVAYYKFTSGATTTDSAGGNNTLTFFNTPTETTGQCAGGMNFASASSEYGAAANPPIIGDDDNFSICAWFKSTQGTWGTFYSEGNTGDDNPLLELGISGTVAGDIIFAIRSDGGTQSVDYSSGDINADDGQWHHACIVQTAGNARQIYFDGSASGGGNTADVSNARTLNNSQVGRLSRTTASDYYNGDLDQVRVYSSALTSTQISNIYNDEN